MGKNSFVLYETDGMLLEFLEDHEAGKLLRAIFEYVKTGSIPELGKNEKKAFNIIKDHIDRDAEKYAERCEKNRGNGAKGGKKRYENMKQAQANASDCKQSQADNDNVNDSVNVNENDNDNSHFTFTPYTYREGEGEPLPPPSDEGGPAPSPFTLTDVKACAANPVNGINLSPEQIQGFYDWMEKYNWTINGEPVTNLVRALRGFQKREDKKAENSMAEKTEDEFYLQRFSDADVADEIMQKYENDIFSFCKNKFDMERIVNENFDLSQDEYNGYEVDDYLTKDFKPKGFLKKQIFLEWLYYSYAEGALLPALTTKEKNKIFQVVCYKGYAEKKEIVENRKKSQEKEKAQAIS